MNPIKVVKTQSEDGCRGELHFGKWDTNGGWILSIPIAVCIFIPYFLNKPLYGLLFFSQAKVSPGDYPPWYFIRLDLAEGTASLVGGIVGALLLCILWRPHRIALSAAFLLMLFSIPKTWTAIIILARVDVRNMQGSECYWPDFDSYLGDYSLDLGWVFVVVFLLATIGLGRKLENRDIHDE